MKNHGKSAADHAELSLNYAPRKSGLKEARKNWLQSFHDDAQRAEAEPSDFLAYQDSDGRFADFHSLRHGYITMIGKAGVSPREHQDLARHSTYAMTSRCTHSRFYDLSAAVQGLPIPTAGAGTNSQTLAATGTDGKADTGKNSLGPFLGPQLAMLTDFGGQTRTEELRAGKQENPGKHHVSQGFLDPQAGRGNVEAPGIEPSGGNDVTPKVITESGLRRRCCAANALQCGVIPGRRGSFSDTILATLTGTDLIEVAKSWAVLAPAVRESVLVLIRASVHKPNVQGAKS